MENITLGNLEIRAADLSGTFEWDNIDAAIESLGGQDWRLPTTDEFATLFHLSQDGTLILKPDRYWAGASYLNDAWYYDLSKGYSPHIADKSNLYYVRLVRTI